MLTWTAVGRTDHMVFSYWTVSIRKAYTKLTKSKHENPHKGELTVTSTKRQGKKNFLLKCPKCGATIWHLAWCKYPLNPTYPICSKRAEGDLASEETVDRKRETTQRRLMGRGELGWKDSGEQSEINLDTPDGLKFVYVCVWAHVHMRVCVAASLFIRACV